MSALPPADIDRLGKFLRLLGSDQVGERAAAALKATGFLRARGKDWSDVVTMIGRPPVVVHAPRPASARPQAPTARHQADARTCLGTATAWNDRERDFLAQMVRQRRQPSDKQADWLADLLHRATATREKAHG